MTTINLWEIWNEKVGNRANGPEMGEKKEKQLPANFTCFPTADFFYDVNISRNDGK